MREKVEVGLKEVVALAQQKYNGIKQKELMDVMNRDLNNKVAQYRQIESQGKRVPE
jgi:hypothetical protein